MAGNIDNHINFGSVSHNAKTLERLENSVKNIAENLWDMGFGYIEENDNVFSGVVADETSKWLSRIHRLGVVMREGQEKHSFDTKM